MSAGAALCQPMQTEGGTEYPVCLCPVPAPATPSGDRSDMEKAGTDLVLGLRVPLKSRQTGLHLRELYETCGLRVPSWLQVTIATSWWPRATPISRLQVPNGDSRNWPGYSI